RKTRPGHQGHNGVQEQKADYHRQLPTGQLLHVSSVSGEHEKNVCPPPIHFTWPGNPSSARKERLPASYNTIGIRTLLQFWRACYQSGDGRRVCAAFALFRLARVQQEESSGT